MKILYYLLMLCIGYNLNAQSEILDINAVRANINANGCLFTSSTITASGYEVPNTNGNGPKTIFNSSFWIGGKDQNDSVRVCANMFIADEKDFKTGPVSTNYSNPSFINKYDYIYTITSTQIHDHQINWNDANYTIPDDIVNWPGNGDIVNGEAAILAPFVDYNANNLYEPNLGDHPIIRGDKAMYFILNDNDGDHPHSGGMNMDMEYHFMIYQYATAGFLDSTTFINLKIINRSQNTYNQLIVANYTDFDIGGAMDDYAGCSSVKNMIFGYNGDNGVNSGTSTQYGLNPPACGIKLLNHEMKVSGTFAIPLGIHGDPKLDSTIWRALNAQFKDGTPYTVAFNGITPTNYLFDGNPNDTSSFSELSANMSPGGRRAFMATEPIDNFSPNDFICYDFAVLYSRTGGNNLLNVNGLFDVADSAQAFYDAQPYFYCETVLLGENELYLNNSEPSIYPNPAKDQFKVSIAGHFDLTIYDISGKVVRSIQNITANQNIKVPRESGIYLLKISKKEQVQTLKLVVK